jgi:pilus assembly protein CpaC
MLLLSAGPLAAQDAGVTEAAGNAAVKPSPMRVRIQSLNGGPKDQIHLLTGRGILIDLDRPLKRAAVGDPRVAEVSVISPRQAMVNARSVGTTNLILWDEDERQLAHEIVVRLDIAQLREAIASAAPGGAVEVIAVNDKIVLRGTVPDVDTAQRIVQIAELFTSSANALSSTPPSGGPGAAGGQSMPDATIQGGQGGGGGCSSNVVNHLVIAGEHQVVLRCTVAEVTKTAIRTLGINGWLAGDNIRDVFAVNQIGGINPVNIGAAGSQNVIRSNGLLFATDKDGLVLQPTPELSLGFPRVQMQLFFKALRDNRLLRVLAEPNLVAVSGQEASFLAGGEFPSVTSQGITGTTIEWKEFGVRLRFTPTVIGRQMIRLRVAPEVSELDPATGIFTGEVRIPFGLTQRRAETTIELASGSTIAIAGLLNERVRGISQKIPALGDVPVLGALFSSVNYQKDVTELVILVTPELVSSLQPDQVESVPGQFMTDPNDFQLFGLGMVSGEPAPEPDEPEAALQTNLPPRYRKYSSPPDQMTLHGPWGPADAAEAVQ